MVFLLVLGLVSSVRPGSIYFKDIARMPMANGSSTTSMPGLESRLFTRWQTAASSLKTACMDYKSLVLSVLCYLFLASAQNHWIPAYSSLLFMASSLRPFIQPLLENGILNSILNFFNGMSLGRVMISGVSIAIWRKYLVSG